MPLPPIHALSLYEGDTTIFRGQFKNEKGPVNLAGALISFGAKKSFLETTPLFLKSAQIYNAALGKFAIVFTPDETDGITKGKVLPLVYDIQVILPTGVVTTVARGDLTIAPEVH